MWSTGVILYACLSGSYPFTGDRQGEIAAKIRVGRISMDSPRWDRVSETAKDLVRSLLNKDSYERLPVEEALVKNRFNFFIIFLYLKYIFIYLILSLSF